MTKEELAEIRARAEEALDMCSGHWGRTRGIDMIWGSLGKVLGKDMFELLDEVERQQRMLAEIYTVLNHTGDLDELVGIFEEARYGENE